MRTGFLITCTTFLLILPLLLIVNCKKEILDSQWVNSAINIDGDQGDWQGPLHYNEKLEASLAVRNDSTRIYVLLVSANQALNRQLMMSGLVLWLDQDGGRIRDIGFKFPIGLMERQARATDLFMALNPREGAVNEARVNYLLKLHFNDLQILDAQNVNLGIFSPVEARSKSIQFALRYHDGKFVYELGLPLEHTGRGEWSIKETAQFAIGLETPQFDISQLGGRPPNAMGLPDATTGSAGGMGGGMRGGGMRGGGMQGGRGGGGMMVGRSGMQEPIKYWTTINRANAQ